MTVIDIFCRKQFQPPQNYTDDNGSLLAMNTTCRFCWTCILLSVMLRFNVLQRISPRIVSAFSVAPFHRGAITDDVSVAYSSPSFRMTMVPKQRSPICRHCSTFENEEDEEEVAPWRQEEEPRAWRSFAFRARMLMTFYPT
jgi:hypothetical protein